jgi:hypothetical protein
MLCDVFKEVGVKRTAAVLLSVTAAAFIAASAAFADPGNFVATGLLFVARAVPPTRGEVAQTSRTLDLRGVIPFVSVPAACPDGVAAEVICHSRSGEGPVPGLGRVSESYVYMADNRTCVSAASKILSYLVRLSVAGKGELTLRMAETSECIPELAANRATQSFTVIGATGKFGGASGSGTVTRQAGLPGARVLGVDTWTGTLSVPGVDFDTTAPTIKGAVSKVVRAPRRAKRVPVTYSVSATDDIDGPVEVSCRPPSGSRFKIGRTRVTCAAGDSSGNVGTAAFVVSVRRSR